MRLTFSDLQSAHFRNIGKAGEETNVNLLADFKYSLGVRYQMVMGSLSEYINQDTQTASTVAAQQYYYYPVGTIGVDSATITINSYKHVLQPIYSQVAWNTINAVPFQATTWPQFIFPRRDDFGVWPIPQDVYTIEFNRYVRDRNLLVADVTGTNATLTQGSTTVSDATGLFTAAMVGRWFTVTDTTKRGQGYWYRISTYTSTTSIELETFWNGSTTTAAAWTIGESPELPEEGHVILPAGTAADYYMGLRNDSANATWWNNVYWTGDGNNSNHDFANKGTAGGVIGLIRKYKDRERDNLVHRNPRSLPNDYKIWSQSITE